MRRRSRLRPEMKEENSKRERSQTHTLKPAVRKRRESCSAYQTCS